LGQLAALDFYHNKSCQTQQILLCTQWLNKCMPILSICTLIPSYMKPQYKYWVVQ
jgi:hypothetical protein